VLAPGRRATFTLTMEALPAITLIFRLLWLPVGKRWPAGLVSSLARSSASSVAATCALSARHDL
jgi:hypothetical protein